MALSGDAVRSLATGICNQAAANEIAAQMNASVGSAASSIAALGDLTDLTTVPAGFGAATAIGVTTNITTVPSSFADLPAVQTYLAGANMVPNIEARLDALEAQGDALVLGVAAVQTYLAGSGAWPRLQTQIDAIQVKVDAVIAALKASGQMTT